MQIKTKVKIIHLDFWVNYDIISWERIFLAPKPSILKRFMKRNENGHERLYSIQSDRLNFENLWNWSSACWNLYFNFVFKNLVKLTWTRGQEGKNQWIIFEWQFQKIFESSILKTSVCVRNQRGINLILGQNWIYPFPGLKSRFDILWSFSI